eukprot:Protomagalhaensia_wolfi_Nauph_80__1085@NODE_1633_length_1430_cov_263_576564_g1265_i0_p1_GENE_NODE_1633_length_1430_cov_263_576564_g1265_i0NODE_1633_length_1430_cov_263_576564_g1265_i0_p1_ORF_typecomplete_len387_score100_77Integrin_beta/PF00362_18/2_4e30VWA/PF00092_28/0_00014VWA/PF00092_28/8_6e02VWA_2/PF13519_6/0_0045Mito_fiss_reg/PF05308_11/0_061Podoplanin/PF05808_11/0_86_NODE_1633_length_1430_cov_263_576564_g1265_i01031263
MKFLSATQFFLLGAVGKARQEQCKFPLDLMFLQDTTGSFDDDLPQILRQLNDLSAEVLEEWPGTRFGVAEFRDKPYFPLGEADDFCYKLNEGALSSDHELLMWQYERLIASGGADLPESTFQAIINVVLDPAVGWREGVTHIVVLVTDAVTHLPGAALMYSEEEFPDLPRDWPVNSGGISTGDLTYECLWQDYPSWEQTKDVLEKNDITLFILTPDDDESVVDSWRWVNDIMLAQPSNYYMHTEDDSSDLMNVLIEMLKSVEPECQEETTPKPTTPQPTTTTTTVLPTAAMTTPPPPPVPTTPELGTASTSPQLGAATTSQEVASTLDVTEVRPTGTGTGTGTDNCECGMPCPCFNPCCLSCCGGNDGVVIALRHKPVHLHLEVSN